MRTIAGAMLIFLMSILFGYISGFSVSKMLEDLGMKISTGLLALSFAFATFVAVVIVAGFSFLGLASKKITVTETTVRINRRDVVFDNIARFYYKDNGISDALLKKGQVIFELTGTGEQQMEMDFVDNPQSVADKIQSLLNNYRMRKLNQFSDLQRISRITADF